MPHLMDSLPPQDIMIEVRKFISATARSSQSSNTLELTRTALSLLKNVSATREAVLEHFCTVFSVAVTKFVRQIETRQNVPIPEENIIAEIHTVLSSFINNNPEAWAPIISAWSLELLGNISSDYSKRMNMPVNAGLNDSLQQWMSCQATRTLIDITAQCLQCLMYSDSESCIKTLLDTSVMHSPHFDWVVAHVGSCFPNVVITRVLSCGLKDFCKDKRIDSKLNSVVGILSHLAGSHFYDIRTALLDLFMWSLDENVNVNDDMKTQRLATVPFLLNLASLSSMLLKALTGDISQILRPDVIPRLALFSAEWVRYFSNDSTKLIKIVVHLALGCDQGALQIINTLLDTSLNPSNVGYHSVNAAHNVKNVCREILELMLEEIEFTVRTDHSNTKLNNMRLIISIKQDLPSVIPMLLNPHPLRVKTAVRLLSILGTQNPNVLISAANHLLQNAETNFHLGVLVRLITDNDIQFAKKNKSENNLSDYGYFTQVIEQAIRDVQYSSVSNDIFTRRVFKNLTTLLKWEKSGRVSSLKSNFITRAVRVNLLQMSVYLTKTNNYDLANDIAEMLNCLDPPNNNFPANVELTLRLTRAVIRYFFICIAENDIIKKQRGVKIVCRFLKGLTNYSQYARVLACREILETTIFGDPAQFFGARKKFTSNKSKTFLLQQNHKQGTGAILAQRHSSVFHAGIIGHGPRKLPLDNNIDKEIVTLNKTLLMDVIKACCNRPDIIQCPVDTEALYLVSLLLVELISPDVMYNGLPWPDEEFAKVTVERDLQIRRTFDDAPVLWTLLQLTAWYRPALTYCSVLMRAIVATVLANWDANKGVMITNIMALGQLLPMPLTSIPHILPVLEPHQITTVMRECVWMYMQEHVPAPALFTRVEGATISWRNTDTSTPDIRFTETLRLLLLANIHVLGPLYATLFFNENK
ncbi:integrator complex subunit 5 [Phymastichus coffea]|uniref:integrator complex subunit 5 n=1 Tax=Phymastichus coffea TaxID=108790 RepID=UPI00273A922E|nr:integrator complex subunit 5 [Phymastichus coffea]